MATGDPWDEPSTSALPRVLRPAPAMNIPDDWDADTDEEEEDSKAVWEAANSKSPMPTILPSQTSTSTPTSLPPLEALKPKMKILKRQTASTGPSEPQHAGNDQGQSLQERERLYREARERIFGQGAVQAPESAPKVEVQIARNPRGPEAGNGSERGFARRKNTSISSEKQLKGEDGVISSTSS